MTTFKRARNRRESQKRRRPSLNGPLLNGIVVYRSLHACEATHVSELCKRMGRVVRTGILIRGVRLGSDGWFDCLLGKSGSQLRGQFATAIIAAANAGLENIEAIVIGSGASVRPTDGVVESVAIKNLFLDAIHEQVRDYLAGHPVLQSFTARQHLDELFGSAICDTESQDAGQEVRYAASIFRDHGIRQVIQVTNPSDALEHNRLASVASVTGFIPSDQFWLLATGHLTAGGHPIASAVSAAECSQRDQAAS